MRRFYLSSLYNPEIIFDIKQLHVYCNIKYEIFQWHDDRHYHTYTHTKNIYYTHVWFTAFYPLPNITSSSSYPKFYHQYQCIVKSSRREQKSQRKKEKKMHFVRVWPQPAACSLSSFSFYFFSLYLSAQHRGCTCYKRTHKKKFRFLLFLI